ncbi:unnamed protein product [Camellia sinensis]
MSNDVSIIFEISRSPRGKALTIIEDEILYRSWLAVSQDSIADNSQAMAIFWERADKVAEAKCMYHAIQKNHFTFDTSWEICAKVISGMKLEHKVRNPHHQRIHIRLQQLKVRCWNPTTIYLDQQRSSTSTRPIGTKAAKDKLKKQASHDVRFDEMVVN